MKSYEVHRILKPFGKNSTENLAKETQEFINRKVNEGFELVSTQFDTSANTGYIYSFMVFKR